MYTAISLTKKHYLGQVSYIVLFDFLTIAQYMDRYLLPKFIVLKLNDHKSSNDFYRIYR